MRAVVLLGLFVAGALCAPLGEQVNEASVVAADDLAENELRVKRAKEAIMFGNQQNEAKEMKKRDEYEISNDTVDKGSNIVVKEPVEIEQAPEGINFHIPADSAVADQESIITEQPAEESEEEETVVNETPTETDAERIENEDIEGKLDGEDISDYEKYMNEIQSDKAYQYYKLLSQSNLNDYTDYMRSPMRLPLSQYSQYYPYAQSRYRRSQTRKFNGANYPRSSRNLKRSHRTKRDLYYPVDALTQEYLPVDDSYLNRPYYGNYPLDEVLDALRGPGAYEQDEDDDDLNNYVNNGYDNYLSSPYDTYLDEDDDDDYLPPWYDVPLKRQANLAYVPGIKRSRDFYPYFQEPDTHFQAFVPQKRSPTLEDYADAYQKVMELAAALREKNYYPRGYELGYNKKK